MTDEIVSQRAREAAADLMAETLSDVPPGDAAWSETVRGGEDDGYPFVRAFARFEADLRQSTPAVVEAAEVLNGIEVARRRIAPLMKQGEDAIWRPAQFAYEVLGNAAAALSAAHQPQTDQGEAVLRPMSEAPEDASWIVAWFKRGWSVYPLAVHYASDLSGSEQPSYQGWFQTWGDGFSQVRMADCIGWEPISEKAAIRQQAEAQGDGA